MDSASGAFRTTSYNYNSSKPYLNIITFSGRRAHHLIETWRAAQFQEVSAT